MKKKSITSIKSIKGSSFGFTLIELLVVFSVIAILSSVGIAAFVAHSRTQTLNSEAQDLVSVLQVARSRSLSQVKPNQGPCVTQPLDGYRVDVCGLPLSRCSGVGTYELHAVCASNTSLIESGKLATNVNFYEAETQPVSFLFRVISGGVEGGTITIVGYDQKRTITISPAGPIQVTSSRIIAPSPTPTPTVTPILTSTPTPEPTLTPTPTLSQKRIFVTSTTYKGDLGGILGADSKCQERAQSANLPGTWKAWVSDSATHAKDRISDGIYIGIDGEAIANNKSDLINGSIENKIDHNELNNQEGAKKIWTATNSDGTGHSKTCNNWASLDDDDKGRRGKSDKTNGNWTNDGEDECDTNLHLFCFEQ